jgi:hypothetical protein
LGDTSERDSNRLNLDLTSEPVLSFPHGNSKGEEHVLDIVGRPFWRLSAAGEKPAMPLPRDPVPVPDGPVHCRRSNRRPRNVSKTFDFNHSGTIASCHSCWSGNENVVLKDEMCLGSEITGPYEWNIAFALVGREAMSAMILSVPGTWIVVSRPA